MKAYKHPFTHIVVELYNGDGEPTRLAAFIDEDEARLFRSAMAKSNLGYGIAYEVRGLKRS